MTNEVFGRNRVFPILNADGTPFHNLVLRKATVESIVMSLGDKITGDVYYKDNDLAVSMSEYIEYKNNPDDNTEDAVKYVLVNPPTIIREGLVSENSELKGMTKYSFEFYHPMYMLGNFPFTDVAVSNNEEAYLSQNKTFSWIGNLSDFSAKLNANLRNTEWVVALNIPPQNHELVQKAGKKSDVLSFDKVFISDALKTAYDTWGIPFVITSIKQDTAYYSQGKRFKIEFGLPTQEIYAADGTTPFVFRFGKGLGLKNNSRTPKNNKIVTRIAGYGAERNIPYGYPQIVWTGNQSWNYTINNASGMQSITVGGVTIQAMSYPIYDGIVGGERVRLIKHPFTRTTLMPSIYSQTVNKKVNPLATGYNPSIEIKDYYDAQDSQGYPNPINPLSPSFELHQFEDIYPRLDDASIVAVSPIKDNEVSYITFSAFDAMIQDLINNAINQKERDALVDLIEHMADISNVSAASSNNGGSYTFAWSYKTDNDFYYVKYTSDNANIDETVLRMGESAPTPAQWDDSIDDDGKLKQSYFKIKLPQLSFDLYASAAITEQMQINMRSGACMGCTFDVYVDWEDYKKNFFVDGVFTPNGSQRNLTKYPKSQNGQIEIVVQKDLETFGTVKPNIYQHPTTGDSFVVLGVSLPQQYIVSAEHDLDDTMRQYMMENNIYYYDYPLKIDEYFLATHTNILAQIRNNCKFNFQYAGTNIVLFVKQIVIKFGEKVLPQYDITLTDDIDIVLNKIGQVTDDVSRMRVQVSELQKYYSENIINELNNKLSRVIDDVCLGRITFQNGLDSIGRAIFHDELRSPQYETGLYDGRGWRIDNLGNAELESLRVRSYLEIVELLVNRMQAQEGDTLFTDNDQIDKVEVAQDGSYILSLKEKYDGYVTGQMYGNILKGIINTMAAKQAGVSEYIDSDTVETDGVHTYFTSWMRVVETSSNQNHLSPNQIRVVLYSDGDTPSGKNFVPCELMNIARWGCFLNPNEQGISASEKADRKRRQNLFMISTSDGRLVKLNGVNTPKLSNGNYGTTLGELPDFVKAYPAVAQRLVDGGDYLYAQGIVVGDFIKIDVNGVPIVSYVDCGEWQDDTTYLCNEYNSTTKQYETHDVWHNNALWRCLQHEPVTVGGVTTYYEPTEQNSDYWQKLMEGTNGADYIYLRGSGGVGTREVNVNGGENLVSHSSSIAGGTGIELTVINRQTLAKVSSTTYNTYSDGGTALPALVAALQTLDDTVFVCLTSCDATEWSNELVNALTSFGLEAYDYENDPHRQYPAPDEWLGARSPFVFLGYLGLEQGYGIFVQQYAAPSPLDAKASVFVSNGLFASAKNGEDGTSVSKTGADTYRYAVSASGSTTPSTWYATKQAAIDAYTGTTGGTWPKNTFMWTETTIHWNTGNTILYNAERNPSDGTNAFVVDLDPQMTSVALRDGDLVDDVDLYFYPRAYYGSTPVINDCTIDASTTDPDFTITADNTNHRVRVQIPQGTGLLDSNEVTCTVTHSTYGSRTVKFILAGVNNGDDGSPAVLQEIIPSRSAISFARQENGALTPPSRDLTLQIKKTVGDVCTTETVSQSGLTVMYSFSSMPSSPSSGTVWGTSDGTSGASWSSNTLTIQSSIAVTNLYIAAFNSSGTLVDMETIPIVKDGDNGDNGDDAIEYTVKTSVDNISIQSNEISATLSATATFYKKEGQNAEVAYSGYYGIYQRSGNSYTRIAYNSTSVSTYSISTEVTSAIDAIVIFLFSSNYSGSSPDTQAYLAKKEIVVSKKTDNVNPNILLRTVFDRGINPVKEIWWSGSWSYVGVEITNSNLLEGRHPLVIDGQSYGSDLDLSQNVYQKVKTSTWYTLSFYAKANASYNTFIYSGSSSYACIDVNAGIYIDGVFQSGSAPQSGVVSWPSSGSFVRHTVTFKTKSTFNTTQVNIMFRASSSCKLYLCMPKLENGKVGTAYMAHESDLVGNEGVKGDAGRMYYYADVWDATNTTKTFTANDAQTPFFKVGSSYYVYVGSENFTDKTMSWINSNIGAPSSSDVDWQIMVNDFKYLITDAVFGNYAQFGANIINGDYRFSQYGYMRGFEELKAAITDSTQYQNCDPDDMFGEDDFFDPAKMLVNTTFDSYTEIADDATTNRRYTIIGNMIEFAQSSSPSLSSIRNIWTGGYTYFRYKDSETAITYSSWIYMQNGNNYYFAVGSSATTEPSSGWSTYPTAQTAQKPYLWLRIVNSGSFTYKRVSSKIAPFNISYSKWYAIEFEMAYDSVFSNNSPVNIKVGTQSSQITVGSTYYKEVPYSYNDTERVRVCLLFKCEVSGVISDCNLWTNQPHQIYAAFLRESQFVPYLCEDLLQGKVVLNNVVARGELHTDSLYYSVIPAIQDKEIFVRDNSIVTIAFNAYGTKVILPSPTVSAGRVIEIFSGLDNSASSSNPQKYQWKLSFEGAVESGNNKSYFKNLVGYSNVYKAVNNYWKETYVKLFSDGTDWFVLKAEYTTTVNSEYVTVLATKYHP